MFTGLVEDLGTVVAVDATGDGVHLTLETPLAGQLGEGDSIAVNGVCLTAVGVDGDRFGADVMRETLRRSSLNDLAAGSQVNLELALRADARLGGHIMQGHVDGVGTVERVREDGFARVVTIAVAGGPTSLLRYVVEKGSIAIDGISLTVARVDDAGLDVSLIPETLERTTLGVTTPGRTVNLEVDILAKYVEKAVKSIGQSPRFPLEDLAQGAAKSGAQGACFPSEELAQGAAKSGAQGACFPSEELAQGARSSGAGAGS